MKISQSQFGHSFVGFFDIFQFADLPYDKEIAGDWADEVVCARVGAHGDDIRCRSIGLSHKSFPFFPVYFALPFYSTMTLSVHNIFTTSINDLLPTLPQLLNAVRIEGSGLRRKECADVL